MRHKYLLSFFGTLAIACSSVGAVERWGVFELAISATEAPRTIDSVFSATFSQGSQSISVPGSAPFNFPKTRPNQSRL